MHRTLNPYRPPACPRHALRSLLPHRDRRSRATGPRARSRFCALLAIALGAATGVGPALANSVVVGNGSALHSGSGAVDLGCANLLVDGTAAGDFRNAANVTIQGAGALGPVVLEFSGNWSNTGNPSVPGLVRWLDGCGVGAAGMLGNSAFANLAVESAQGRTVRFDVAGAQSVDSALLLAGAAGAPLFLRSTAPGTRARLFLDGGGSQSIAHLDVADMDANDGQRLGPGPPGQFASVDAGNNLNWFLGGLEAVPVPAIRATGLFLLVLLMGAFGITAIRQTHTTSRFRSQRR